MQKRSTTRRRGVLLAGTLEAMLGAAPEGLTTSAIAATENVNPDRVLALLKDLERRGHVRREGSRRTTRWHMVSDEERILARARELERRSPDSG